MHEGSAAFAAGPSLFNAAICGNVAAIERIRLFWKVIAGQDAEK
jgi:hypothetical protein